MKKGEDRIKKQNAENRARKEKFKSSLTQLYGSYDAQRILNHQYWHDKFMTPIVILIGKLGRAYELPKLLLLMALVWMIV